MRRASLVRVLPCLALLTVPACGDSADFGEDTAGTASLTSPSSAEGGESGGPATDPGDGSAEDSAAGSTGGGGEEEGDSADGSGGAEEAGDEGDSEGDSEGEPIDPGQLTAGEWRDLDHWQFWLDLMNGPKWGGMAERWGFNTQERFAVVVTAGQDGPALADAKVVLLAGEQPLWAARTDVHGQAELFSGVFASPPEGARQIQVTVDGVDTYVDAEPSWQSPIVIAVEDAAAPQQVLDLMFMVDTTGSMGDELSYLQAELADVLDRVRQEVGQDVVFRVSVNFYRDDNDDYLVRSFPFTTDIDQAIDDLNDQDAGGGGDTPEAVEAALEDAIDAHDWSGSAVARLCFLVLDAPPHEEEEDLDRVRASIKGAAAKGVRMIPLAASGADKPTEFLLRFAAITTGGTYTFLTDHSGIGGGHSEPTIGAYQVELLNDMLVRLISGALVEG
jgi:hypothetical protein